MKPLRSIPALLAALTLAPSITSGEDYSGFAARPEIEKDRIVWNLHEHHLWGAPEQKPICRDLLENQGYSFANATLWTTSAIDLAEKQGWKDSTPLISKIYERPKNLWICQRAFAYSRTQDGKPVSTDLIAAAETLKAAGYYRSGVNDEQLSAAMGRLSKEADKEAVLVYVLSVAGWHAGKGGTERGRKAAVEILRGLDRDMVAQRVRQLLRDCLNSEIEWAANQLGISLEANQR